MQNRLLITACLCICLTLQVAGSAVAQSFKRGGTEFNAIRTVTVPAGKQYAIIVTEFFHHGEIQPDGKNVAVFVQNRQAPLRVLQVGPGDFCRLAFQTLPGQSEYDICYGGQPPTEQPPPWIAREGLLLETRQFIPCDFNSLDSVRKAFEKAAPIGADYVDGVFHRYNPFSLQDKPFLSRYSGQLDIRKPGVYGFMVTSQDCSFLLVDDRLIISAPGRHGPAHQARPGMRQDVKLSAGEHKFDYYHAAGGEGAVMVAAWEPEPAGDKPQRPEAIPPEVFRSHLIGRLPATRLSLRTAKQVPDFVVKLTNDVPLPDNDVPMIGVLFRDVSVKSLTMQGAKLEWDFGDGQTSELPNTDHVYLRPGIYAVKLSVQRGKKVLETTNRIEVDRPRLDPKEKLYTFDDYLRIIEGYNPATLDAASLRQLVLAFETKALALAARAEDAAARDKAAEEDPNRRPDARKTKPKASAKKTPTASDNYLAKAVSAGKAAFVGPSAAKGDEELLQLAELVGPMARLRLGDADSAFQIWRGATERIAAAEPKAECEIAAAEVAINDLLNIPEGKALLEAAESRFGKGRLGPIAAHLLRVWGDYHAAVGDGAAAREAYTDAENLGGFSRPLVETTATRGAHGRSAEEFVKLKKFARAAEELDAWQSNFPTEKIEGYWSLLCAKYWAGRGMYAQAIAQAERLQTVNPNSPYIDQIMLTAADSEMRRGKKDRALAILHDLQKNHPGSPLIPVIEKNIKALEGAGK